MAKNTERFSNRVDNYIRYRPSYPAQVAAYLTNQIGVAPDWTVADIGSGTGISAEIFLRNGNKVYAVEPNKEMREAADQLLSKYKGYISVNGSSEVTTLSTHSIDLIIAAQAFHWFDREAFQKECNRIARTGGYCLLMWNERKVVSDFEKAYEELLIRYGTDYQTVDHRNIKEKDLELFFAPHPVTSVVLHNEQIFDFEGVKGRLLSSSYAPNTGDLNFDPMISQLRKIFDRYQKSGKVSFGYDCNLFLGKI